MRSEISLVAALAAGSLLVAPLFGQGAGARAGRSVVLNAGKTASYIGLGVAEIDSERAKALKLNEEHGVEVKNVSEEGPAEKAGVRVGDVVLEYNGQRVEGMEQFVRMVRETPVGRQAKLTIWRNGATQTLTATIGSRPAVTMFSTGDRDFDFHIAPMPPMPPMSPMPGMPGMPRMPDMPRPSTTWGSPVLGVETESLTSQLADFFGVKEGALVRSVTKESAAERAGIKAGDVITRVDGTAVTGSREIGSVLRGLRGSKRTFPVVLVRNRKEMTVTVTLPDEGAPATRVRASLERVEL